MASVSGELTRFKVNFESVRCVFEPENCGFELFDNVERQIRERFGKQQQIRRASSELREHKLAVDRLSISNRGEIKNVIMKVEINIGDFKRGCRSKVLSLRTSLKIKTKTAHSITISLFPRFAIWKSQNPNRILNIFEKEFFVCKSLQKCLLTLRTSAKLSARQAHCSWKILPV